MDGFEIGATVVTILLAVLSIVLGGHIKLLKKEMGELISVIALAIEDKHVTRAELKSIIKEAMDVKDVVFKIHQLLVRKGV